MVWGNASVHMISVHICIIILSLSFHCTQTEKLCHHANMFQYNVQYVDSSFIPRSCPAFRCLQYRKRERAWYIS